MVQVVIPSFILYLFHSFSNTKLHTGGGGGQIITVPDPVTGQLVQQLIQTVIDPVTGQPKQTMIPLSSSGSKYYNKTHCQSID